VEREERPPSQQRTVSAPFQTQKKTVHNHDDDHNIGDIEFATGMKLWIVMNVFEVSMSEKFLEGRVFILIVAVDFLQHGMPEGRGPD
jgi:hypothetical protein